MYAQYDTAPMPTQTPQEESQWWARELESYLTPYQQRLDAYLDRGVVGNLTAIVAGIAQSRSELTTSGLGSTITGPAHAEAGLQRIQRALHHRGWQAEVILRGDVEASGAVLPRVGEPRRNPFVHLGQECTRETRKRETGRLGSRAFQSSTSAGAQP